MLIEDTAATLADARGAARQRHRRLARRFRHRASASLAYLNDFPFSKIKIDRKFSQNVDQSPRTPAIIKGIAQITRDLRIELVAEGVETELQLERMRSFGINAIQGYLFSKPLPVRAAAAPDHRADLFRRRPTAACQSCRKRRRCGEVAIVARRAGLPERRSVVPTARAAAPPCA